MYAKNRQIKKGALMIVLAFINNCCWHSLVQVRHNAGRHSCCVVLLRWEFATGTVTNFAVAGELLCDRFGSDVADVSLSLDANGL